MSYAAKVMRGLPTRAELGNTMFALGVKVVFIKPELTDTDKSESSLFPLTFNTSILFNNIYRFA